MLNAKNPIAEPLVPLPRAERILATADIISDGVVGVGSVFREDADVYDERYYDPEGQKILFHLAIEKAGILLNDIDGPVLDIGCGSGNSTFAILNETKRTHVYATDLSPEMLDLLQLRAERLGKSSRVTAFVANAEKVRFAPGSCSLIVGSSMAHHMMDPERFLLRALKALRPGGVAYFLEPFQAGHFAIRQAMSAIVRMAAALNFESKQIDFLSAYLITIDTMMREEGRDDALYETLEDKWIFPRSLFEKVGRLSDCEVSIFSVTPPGAGVKGAIYDLIFKGTGETASLPDWAVSYLQENDSIITSGLREELLSVGCIVFRRH